MPRKPCDRTHRVGRGVNAGAQREQPTGPKRRPVSWRSLLVLWSSVGVVAVGGLVAAGVGLLRWSGAPRDALNVLLISLDTLRADHLGCYGHARVRTPNIDTLARQGVQFMQCASSAPMTLPAHSTMMTGTYPFVHGARVNAQFVLAAENVTLAELLKEHGLATGAEVAAMVLNREYGLSQGFDTYVDPREVRYRRPNPNDLPVH